MSILIRASPSSLTDTLPNLTPRMRTRDADSVARNALRYNKRFLCGSSPNSLASIDSARTLNCSQVRLTIGTIGRISTDSGWDHHAHSVISGLRNGGFR